jgi:hypothetical protein
MKYEINSDCCRVGQVCQDLVGYIEDARTDASTSDEEVDTK